MSAQADKTLAAMGVELSVQHIEGRYISGQTIQCRECGTKETISTGNIAGGRLPPDALERKFKLKGWEHRHSDRWYCPLHGKRSATGIKSPERAIIDYRAKVRQQAEQVFMPVPGNAVPEPIFPKEKPVSATVTRLEDLGAATIEKMSPADYRRIFRAIDDAWDESTGRYAGGGGDGKIATALDVPRAWVEHVRKDGVGQNGGNDELEGVTAQLANAQKIATTLTNDALALAARAEAMGKEIERLTATVNRIKVATGQR